MSTAISFYTQKKTNLRSKRLIPPSIKMFMGKEQNRFYFIFCWLGLWLSSSLLGREQTFYFLHVFLRLSLSLSSSQEEISLFVALPFSLFFRHKKCLFFRQKWSKAAVLGEINGRNILRTHIPSIPNILERGGWRKTSFFLSSTEFLH